MRDAQVNAETLLAWYDTHARDLPWRVPPLSGRRADPYRVWLSEVMLQQTTVAAVKSYFATFTQKWPDVDALAAAEDAEVMAAWAGLGYYARARNLLKCARVVSSELNGRFPQTEAELLNLPGIGPYTAAAIAAIAFDQPAAVLDANVERVMARVFAVQAPLPDSKEILRAHAKSLTPANRPGDYAQAVMDLGAGLCSVRAPQCGECPWSGGCKALALGIADELPRKKPKQPKPQRFGTAYLARRADGATLFETRPAKGLLGGMLALPTTDWHESPPEPAPPVAADWQELPAPVKHTFTHFHLSLSVHIAIVGNANPERGHWVEPGRMQAEDLPTVFKKAYLAGLAAMEQLATD